MRQEIVRFLFGGNGRCQKKWGDVVKNKYCLKTKNLGETMVLYVARNLILIYSPIVSPFWVIPFSQTPLL